MEYKTTKQLFRGMYQYKIVLVCAGADLFRSGDMVATFESLKKVVIDPIQKQPNWSWRNTHIKSQADLDYAFRLQLALSKLTDIDVRVESPWISVYTNNKKVVDSLIKLDEERVKYVSAPAKNTQLAENTIIMPKMDYEYRITLGKTSSEHSAFVDWADNNPKIKITKSARKDLLKDRSWGGKHFYITGDNNLLMSKMHLGGCIAKIERIVKK